MCFHFSRTGITGAYGKSVYFRETVKLFSKMVIPFYILTSSSFSTSCQILVLSSFLTCNHSRLCVVLSQCGLNLYFPNDSCFEHLSMSLSFVSSQCILRVLCTVQTETLDGINVQQISSYICGLPFHFLNGIF